MKNNISNKFMKIAGVKNIKDFYAKYPSEAAFFKAHPEAKKLIKKAQGGADINGDGIPDLLQPISPISPQTTSPNNLLQGPSNFVSNDYYQNNNPFFTTNPGATSVNNPAIATPMSGAQSSFDIMPYAKAATSVIGGIQTLNAAKEDLKEARMWNKVTGLQARAAESIDVDANRPKRYVRPEDQIINPNELFPTYGVRTNVLAKNGMYIPIAQDGMEEVPGGMMGREPMIPEVGASSPVIIPIEESKKFDSNSARDTWVQKTGLPWSEAKRLGYTTGSAKDNIKLLNELKDPRFKKENLRTSPVKNSSQSRTPIQHRETPTGKLTPIKKPIKSYEDALKNLPKYSSKQATLKQDTRGSYDRELEAKRKQAEHDDTLYGERILTYLANPSKALGDLRSILNPMFTPESETSESDRREIMANRYNPTLSQSEKLKNVTKMGLKKVPRAAVNTAALLSATPYTTIEAMPIGIGQGAGTRAAGYIGQGARQLAQGAPRMLNQPYTPNFVMYQDGGEIQNTYAPNTLYDDLGYEPLNDSDVVKQYAYGGGIPQAQEGGGFMNFMGEQGGAQALGMLSGAFNNNSGGSQIGSGIGTGIGTAFGGPVGGMIGGALGGMVGGAFDSTGRKMKKEQKGIQRNVDRVIRSQFAKGIQNQYGSYMEDGGWVSHNWNPQVIAKFGDHSPEDVYEYAHEGMESLRSGGNLKDPEYTPVSNRGLQTYAMGGELKTHWGGYAETMSQNPYLPGGGETVMFRGKSHEESDGSGRTGIGITYGNNPVEVERGEPATKLKDGSTGEESLTVYGNLQIPKEYVPMLGDPKAKGKKFKNYIAEISKDEARQNKVVDKSTSLLNDLDVRSPYDKLKFDALSANIKGADMKLKSIADKKMNAAALQNSINDTAEEYGLVADDLAKGKIKFDKEAQKEYAKFGKDIPKAQDGYGLNPWTGNKYGMGKKTASEFTESQWNQIAKKYGFKGKGNKEFQEFLLKNPEASKLIAARHKQLYGKDPFIDEKLGAGWSAPELLKENEETLKTVPLSSKSETNKTTKKESKTYETTPYKRSVLMDVANQILPFIRPTDQEPLNPQQLMGEMYALSTNQLEPVQAQQFTTELATPYDISFQDRMNEITAQTRAAQRMAQGNPAAQALINAQAYDAINKVKGEEFRANQAMKMGVYDQNRQALNQARQANLALLDQQYQRQAQAASNTKAVTQAALNSIADKYAKNRLENRELGVYENLYNYRYDPTGRAINMNPLFQANMPVVYSEQKNANMLPVYDNEGEQTGWRPAAATPGIVSEEESQPAKFGKAVKKYAKNGSIVKAYKNL